MTVELELNLDPVELAGRLAADIETAIGYARRRRISFSRKATIIRLTTLTLAATSTVILGLQSLNVWASIAFSMVALTTLLGAIEPFFNWRSRWIIMEEMKGRLHRLDRELRYFLAARDPKDLRAADLEPYFGALQEAWADSSRQWIISRRGDRPAESPTGEVSL